MYGDQDGTRHRKPGLQISDLAQVTPGLANVDRHLRQGLPPRPDEPCRSSRPKTSGTPGPSTPSVVLAVLDLVSWRSLSGVGTLHTQPLLMLRVAPGPRCSLCPGWRSAALRWPKEAKVSQARSLFIDVKRMPLVFPIPPLSTRGANIVAFLFATSYVVSLYLSKHARLGNSSKPNDSNANAPQNRTRDDPSVIKARMVAASTSTILSCVVVFLLVWHIVDDLENVSDLNLVTIATQWDSSS